MSSDSFRSNAPASVAASLDMARTSSEKSKATKMSMNHSRSLSEKLDSAGPGEVVRSHSAGGRSRASNDFEVIADSYILAAGAQNFCSQDDDELLQEFDELMRSGATMKVSLTPDRLKTMEVSCCSFSIIN